MTDPTSTPAPDDVIEGAFITEDGDLYISVVGETPSAEEGVTFRPATRAELEDHGFKVDETGAIVAEPPSQVDGAPAEVVEPAVEDPAAPKRRRRGTVTDRLRREAEDEARSDG